jgi:streptomycin 6-kinase
MRQPTPGYGAGSTPALRDTLDAMNVQFPTVHEDVRRRLVARFGIAVEGWLNELPHVVGGLVERWQVKLGSPIPRGSMSVVIGCQTRDGRPAVLKLSPDRARLAGEAAALRNWATPHTPTLFAVDEHLGALLLEAVEPGISLAESLVYPEVQTTAELLTALHASGLPDPSHPPLAQRVAYLFDSGSKPYARCPRLIGLIPPSLYERGRQLAMRLVRSVAPTALLHGDLTPRNILDGGDNRGLVAIDPAPCLGDDLAFEAVDLLLWQAEDIGTIEVRAAQLARAVDVDASRLIDWCTAFAAMTALERAEVLSSPRERVQAALTLAHRAPAL